MHRAYASYAARFGRSFPDWDGFVCPTGPIPLCAHECSFTHDSDVLARHQDYLAWSGGLPHARTSHAPSCCRRRRSDGPDLDRIARVGLRPRQGDRSVSPPGLEVLTVIVLAALVVTAWLWGRHRRAILVALIGLLQVPVAIAAFVPIVNPYLHAIAAVTALAVTGFSLRVVRRAAPAESGAVAWRQARHPSPTTPAFPPRYGES